MNQVKIFKKIMKKTDTQLSISTLIIIFFFTFKLSHKLSR